MNVSSYLFTFSHSNSLCRTSNLSYFTSHFKIALQIGPICSNRISLFLQVEQIQEVTKRVPVKQRIEVPKEVLKYVTKVVTKIVEQEVEVAGDVIQIPKPYRVENKIIVPRYINEELPMVVSQLVEPLVYESQDDYLEVVLRDFEPYVVAVDIYVPRPIERQLIPVQQSQRNQTIDVPPSQFNALVKAANMGASDKDVDGLLIKQLDGSIPMLSAPDLRVLPPISDDWKESHSPGQLRISSTPGQSFVYPTLSDRQ